MASPVRVLLVLLVAGAGCGGRVCGSADFVTGGEALATWDEDGDGVDADLVERCGTNWGSFGLRRNDLGLSDLLLDPEPLGFDFEETLRVASVLLPASQATFRSDHLVVGETMGMGELAGGGLHKLGGTDGDTYTTFTLLDGELTVVDGPKEQKGLVEEMSAEVAWKLRWRLEYGDPQSALVYQTWEAEDWIVISDGTEVGDPLHLPPDYVPPAAP